MLEEERAEAGEERADTLVAPRPGKAQHGRHLAIAHAVTVDHPQQAAGGLREAGQEELEEGKGTLTLEGEAGRRGRKGVRVGIRTGRKGGGPAEVVAHAVADDAANPPREAAALAVAGQQAEEDLLAELLRKVASLLAVPEGTADYPHNQGVITGVELPSRGAAAPPVGRDKNAVGQKSVSFHR